MTELEVLQDILFTLQCILLLNIIKDTRHHIHNMVRRRFK